MKKSFFILAIFATLSLLTACSAGYVSEEPVYQENRPSRPSQDHVWVEGNWNWNRQSRSYQHDQGNWVIPTRNRTYESGRWEKNSRGSRWHNGRWH